jgi:fimbrial chaperone protein
LAPADRVAVLRLTNLADAPLRFELKNQRWDQTPNGDFNLVPSDDLLVTPQVMTLRPNQTLFVRIAFMGTRGEREKSYRVLVAELPAFYAPAQRPGLSLTTRSAVNVPVFVAPLGAAKISGAIADPVARAGFLTFSVANTGTVHFKNQRIDVTALGPNMQRLFLRTLEAWYVLPGEHRDYRLELDKATCSQIRAVTISVDGGVRLDRTINLDPAQACR